MNIGTGKPHNIKKVILFIRNNIKLGNPVFGKIPLLLKTNSTLKKNLMNDKTNSII
mgnify:CR=1 FL=1